MTFGMLQHVSGYLLACLMIFMLTLGLPDAAYQVAGAFADAAVLDHIRQEYGLDGTALSRLGAFLGGFVRGDLRSLYTRELLWPVLMEKSLQSAAVIVAATIFAVILGGGLAALMAASTGIRKVVSTLAGIAATVPVFVTATLLLLLSSAIAAPLWLYAGLSLAVFPGILLGTNLFEFWKEARRAPYNVLAWHYGLRGLVLAARALRAAPGTVAVFFNAMIFFVATGLIVVEPLFGIPGVGRWLLTSATRLDMPVILFLGIVLSALVTGLTLCRDALLHSAMPRSVIDGEA